MFLAKYATGGGSSNTSSVSAADLSTLDASSPDPYKLFFPLGVLDNGELYCGPPTGSNLAERRGIFVVHEADRPVPRLSLACPESQAFATS